MHKTPGYHAISARTSAWHFYFVTAISLYQLISFPLHKDFYSAKVSRHKSSYVT